MSRYKYYTRINKENRRQFATLFQEGFCLELPYRLSRAHDLSKQRPTSLMKRIIKEMAHPTLYRLISTHPHIPTTQVAQIPAGRDHCLWVFRNGDNASHQNLVAYEAGTNTFHFRQTINQMMFLLRMLTSPPEDLPLLIGLPGSKKDLAVLERLLKKGASYAEAC